MTEFKEQLSKITEIKDEEISLEINSFSKGEIELADRIINAVNSNKFAHSRKEKIETPEAHNATVRMVNRVCFMMECSYEAKIKGNDFSEFAETLSTISQRLKEHHNATYLFHTPEISATVDALVKHFRSNIARADGGTNFLAHDIAREIIKTWKSTGHKTSLTRAEEGGKRIYITGFGAFIEACEEAFASLLGPENDPHKEFSDLDGLQYAIRMIKENKITL